MILCKKKRLIIIKWGFIGKKQEEIVLIMIEDVSVTQSIAERL